MPNKDPYKKCYDFEFDYKPPTIDEVIAGFRKKFLSSESPSPAEPANSAPLGPADEEARLRAKRDAMLRKVFE